MNIALIIAGGSGQRMQQEIPKQFLNVYDKPVIVYTLEAFQKHLEIDAIAVVCIKGWESILSAYARQFGITKLQYIVEGGSCGQESIYNGLKELEQHFSREDIVLIHDAIRPMISQEIISDCIVTAKTYGSAVAVIPCQEAMLVTEDKISSGSSFPRERLMRTQTPQGFTLGGILDTHARAKELGITNSVASCTLMVETGQELHFSAGSEKNIKLTTVDDMELFKVLLKIKQDEWLR